MVAGELIVAIEKRGAVIGGDQQIDVAVAIKVAVTESAANFGLTEFPTDGGGDIAKFSVAIIEEKLRRLSVADVAANIADGFVDVTIGNARSRRSRRGRRRRRRSRNQEYFETGGRRRPVRPRRCTCRSYWDGRDRSSLSKLVMAMPG